ncbi:TIGR02594 family protein [Rhodoferax sp. OV413]|nr:TIGR02594 family protein [Rhodoferax sp. OV413]
MIDVALGMALLYAVLSLFVTTIQEYVVNSGMRWRSRHMRKTVQSAFGENRALTDSFFAHPLIVSLADGKGGRAPSYIPDDVFAKVFLAVLGHGNHPKTLGLTPAGFMASLRPGALMAPVLPAKTAASTAIRAPAGASEFIASLRLATTDSAGLRGGANGTGDWPAFEADVARWFGDIGERSRGWFKRSSQRWTFAIALLIAVGLNVDSVMIARTLWGDAELRKQLADAAVVVDGARRAAESGASAPRTTTTSTDSLAARYTQVEDGLQALLARLKEEAFLQENSFFAVSCEAAEPASCQEAAVVGEHCRGAGPAPAAPTSAADPAVAICTVVAKPTTTGKTKPATLSPATLWLDQIHRLGLEMATGRAAATTRGAKLTLDANLQERVALVQRSLGAIGSDMALVRLKTPDPKGKASRTMDSLIQDVQTLHARSGELFRFAAPAPVDFDRALAECALQFAKGSSQLGSCVQRRQGEQPFQLPLGFQSSVLARQMSDAELRQCSAEAGGCGTWAQLWNAALNGAILGWLMTAVALSLGAPFWFDTLGRLVKLRASGTPTSDKDDDKRSGGKGDPLPGGNAPPPPPPSGTLPSTGTTDTTSKIEASLSEEEIRNVQRKLQTPATGVFDDATRTAIAARRAKLDMPPGAELDGTLYEAIVERRSPSVKPRPVLNPGASDPLVSDLRERLTQMLGIPARAQGSGEVYDSDLRAAVRLLQGRAGLVPDGVVGEQTWRVIDAGNGTACTADAWMSRAISQLGLDETRDKDKVRQFLAALNLGQLDPATTAWCACFVAWTIQDVGPPPPTNTPEGAKNWVDWGRSVDIDASQNCYGAVVLIRETRVRANAAPQNHVAFLVGKTASGWVVLGGNQGNQGEISVTLFPSDAYEVVHAGMPGSAA